MVMCQTQTESSRSRRGGKTKAAAAAEQKANKQPQRGLGVAQLEKIRLHNQMMAAYHRSGMHHQVLILHFPASQDAGRMQVPFAAPSAATTTPFQPYLDETTGRGIVGVQYYDNLLPYNSSSSSRPPPPLSAHDLRDSSGHRPGQGRREQPPQQQHYWMSSSDGSSSHGSAEELDLELRL
ncbi:hypothetical protein EJB05_50419, partial [Eragrostis curvula]